MDNQVTVTGSVLPVAIAPGGYTIQAPDIEATVRELSPEESASRSDGGIHEDNLIRALEGADIMPQKWFEIELKSDNAPPAAAGAARAGGVTATTRDNEPAIVLTIPSLGANQEYAVLYSDEAGVSRWFFPEPAEPAAAGDKSRGGAGEVVFHLPRESAPTPPDAEARESRGPLSKLGRRLVRVLSWATDDIVGAGARAVAAHWENSRRPYAFRRIGPGGVAALENWDELRGGPVLCLLHGTFSTAMSAFAELPAVTWNELARLYDGRIIAFDHPSLHQSPQENAQTFFDMLPNGADLDLDVITHSRGGLLGREIAEHQADLHTAGRSVRVRKALLVAAPNLGTILTDGDHGISLLDRYTELFTELPDNAFTLTMEGLFMVAKLLLHGALGGLPGLQSMYPPGDYLRRINARSAGTTPYYSVAARFRPSASGTLAQVGDWVARKVFTDIFNEANDGVVPTRACYDGASGVGSFPIAENHRHVFDETVGAHHCNIFRFFDSGDLGDLLTRWHTA
jgi:hypothetical protein